MIFNILDSTTELWMTKYIIGEIFSSGGATLYKNPSDQTVHAQCSKIWENKVYTIFPLLEHCVKDLKNWKKKSDLLGSYIERKEKCIHEIMNFNFVLTKMKYC